MPFESDMKFNEIDGKTIKLHQKLTMNVLDKKIKDLLKQKFGIDEKVSIRFNRNNEIILTIPEQEDYLKMMEIEVFLRNVAIDNKLNNYYVHIIEDEEKTELNYIIDLNLNKVFRPIEDRLEKIERQINIWLEEERKNNGG